MSTIRMFSLSLGLMISALAPTFAGCAAGAQDEDLGAAGAAGEEHDGADPNDASGDESVGEARQAETNATLYPYQPITTTTWSWWGTTHVEITNDNIDQGGYVALQAGAGAPEYIWVGAANRICTAWSYPQWCITSPTTVSVGRQWGGMPLHVTNVSAIPLTVRVY